MITRKKFEISPHFVATTPQAMAAMSVEATITYVNTAVINQQNAVAKPASDATWLGLNRWIGTTIYFIPTSIRRAVRLIVRRSKTLYLKILGTTQ